MAEECLIYVQKELNTVRQECEFMQGMHQLYLLTASLEVDSDKKKEYEQRAQDYLDERNVRRARMDYLLLIIDEAGYTSDSDSSE